MCQRRPERPSVTTARPSFACGSHVPASAGGGGGGAQLGDEQQLAGHLPEQGVERLVRRGLDEHDETGRTGLLQQPGRALAVGRVGGDGLEDLSTMTPQPAHDGARESVGGSDHEGVHA